MENYFVMDYELINKLREKLTNNILVKKVLDKEIFKTDIFNKEILTKKLFNKKTIIISSSVLAAVLITTVSVYSTKAYEVRIDDKYVGQVKNKDIVEKAINEIKEEAKDKNGTEVSFSNEITYKSIFFADRGRFADDKLKENIENSITLNSKAFAIIVNEKEIAFLKDEASAEEVLNKIKAPYIQNEEDSKNVGFVEDVQITEKDIVPDKIMNPEDVLKSLVQRIDEVKKYTIQKGDTISGIAVKYKMKTADIQKANPNLDISKIGIGQELSLTVPRYVINVKKSTYKTTEEKIAYPVEYENTDSLYAGDKKVKENGSEGVKKVSAELVSVNGIYEETKVLSEEVIENPRTQIVYKGTKERPRTVATGIIGWPIRGSISSRFGERWGSAHTGVDFGVPTGTSFQAADGGVVTYAGWEGDYGKLIIINHENGTVTYYGHCNTINVNVGQRVAKGDTIGTVGTTGRTTGSNLHFEVRKNGVPMDPLNYMK